MRTLRYLTLAIGVLLFAACEHEGEFTLPSIADQHITFSIAGQEQRFTSLDSNGNPDDVLFDSGADGTSVLSVRRNSADYETRIQLHAPAVPVAHKSSGYVLTGQEWVKANVIVTTSSMTGSLYCPHSEPGTRDQISYEVLLRVETLGADGTLTGSFRNDPAATGNAVAVEDGSFAVMVR